MSYLLDTNTCIAAMRGNESVCARLASLAPDDCGISVVSYYELLAGVERCRNPSAELKKVESFMAPLRVLPFDIPSAAISARSCPSTIERTGASLRRTPKWRIDSCGSMNVRPT